MQQKFEHIYRHFIVGDWTIKMTGIYTQIVLLLCIPGTVAHLCLISPRQRGPMDISVSGSPTCFRHGDPCGGQPVESPIVSYAPGDTVFFKWQQNFNHYEPGFPGYFDLGIASSAESTNFTTLFVVSDKYVHAQDYQENYTAVVKLPEMECDHCVIRVRYNAHKPGESPFIQCSDIKISKSVEKSQSLKFISMESQADRRKILPLRRALKLKQHYEKKHSWNTKDDFGNLYGFASNPFQPDDTFYTSVGATTGKLEIIAAYPFGIDSGKGVQGKKFMIDEVVAIDNMRNTSYVLINDEGDREETATLLYNIGSTNGSVFQMADIFQFKGGAINALSWYTFGVSAAFRIQPADTAGNYYFEVGQLNFGGTYTKMAAIPKPENLYVNFQWFETNVNNYHRVYALMGNENAPDKLSARVYVFDLFDGNFIGYTELDVSEFTFMSMHSYPNSGEIMYAFSPGLWSDNGHAWSLVAVDTMKGAVKKQCDIAPPGIFEGYYGGSVYQGSNNNNGFLYHVLRIQGTEADVIVAVNPNTCEVRYSDVTNLRHVHSLQKVSQEM